MYRARSLCATVAFGETELLCGAALAELAVCVCVRGIECQWAGYFWAVSVCVWVPGWSTVLGISVFKLMRIKIEFVSKIDN